MYKSRKAGLVTLLALIVGSPAVHAVDVNDYNKGVNLYLHGQYETAMPYLERAASNGGNAQVHYYLADTYYRLGKTADALEEYNFSYKLDPRSSVSAYCQQMIRTLQTYNPGKPNIVDPTTLPQYKQSATPASDKSGQTASGGATKVGLPPIPDPPSLTPYIEVRKWQYLEKVRFASQAADNVHKAEVHQKTMQQLLKEARKIATANLIPAKRAWGETEKNYLSRLEKGGYKEATSLAPYQKAVSDAGILLTDAKMVQSSCQRAAQGMDGPVPTTLVPIDGTVYESGYNPFLDPP